jgi:hypothetical protein
VTNVAAASEPCRRTPRSRCPRVPAAPPPHRGFFKGLYFYFISALFVPFAIIMLPIAKETSLLYLDNRVGLIFLYVIFGLSLNIFIYVGPVRVSVTVHD